MSGSGRDRPPPPPPPLPLGQRSPSLSNTLAIRIVPYSPPRLDGDGGDGTASGTRPSGSDSRQGPDAGTPAPSRPAGPQKEGYASARPGSALSSPDSRAAPLAGRPFAAVSGAQPAAGRHTSSPPTTPARSSAPAYAYSAPYITTTPAHPRPHPHPRPHHDSRRHHRDQLADAAAAAQRPPADSPSLPSSPLSSSPSSPSSLTPRPISRRRNLVAVHADKTFSLVPRGAAAAAAASAAAAAAAAAAGAPSDPRPSLRSPLPPSSTRSSSSHERLSSDALSDDRLSSPPTTSASIPDRSLSPFASSSPGSSTVLIAEDPIASSSSSSPWNYRMVGGLRKVPKTPDLKQKKRKKPVYATRLPSSAPESPLPPLPVLPEASSVADDSFAARYRAAARKPSFASDQSTSASTLSENTNYKIYAASSSPLPSSDDSLPRPFSSDSNVEVLGASSPPAPLFESSPAPFRSPASDVNYVVHAGDPSPPPESLVDAPRRPRPTYSQESLKVLPLRPARDKSNERFGYYKSRSRESLRHASSIKSIKSITSIISQDSLIAPFLVAPAFVNLRGPPPAAAAAATTPAPASSSGQKQDSWDSKRAVILAPPILDPPPSSLPQQPRRVVQMVEPHPHQWSSQLSTVMSEDEEGSSRTVSRSVSVLSGAPSGNRRSSSGWASSHSRQVLSISSSLAQQADEAARTHSRSNSGSYSGAQLAHSRGGTGGALTPAAPPAPEAPPAPPAPPAPAAPPPPISPPPPAASAAPGTGLPPLTVRDQDEHGDGLADLRDVSHQPSRSGLSGFFGSSNSSGRNLPSSASSRAASLTTGAIPAWARVYYGSGERRWLASALSLSDGGPDDGRPDSSSVNHRSGSPSTDHFPLNIYSARKRAREVRPGTGARPDSGVASLETGVPRRLRRITSSIWSPHLRTDRRASRYSVWDPPSVQWSAESGAFGRRNVQVVMFMVGFVFPFGEFPSTHPAPHPLSLSGELELTA